MVRGTERACKGRLMLDWLREFQGLIALSVSLLIGVFAWAFRTEVQKMVQDRASSSALAKVAQQVDDVDRRVISIERHIESMPTAGQFQGLTVALEATRGDMRALAAEVRGNNELLRVQVRKTELIDEFLRRQGA